MISDNECMKENIDKGTSQESPGKEQTHPLFPPLQELLNEDPIHEALLRSTISIMQRLVRDDKAAGEELEGLFEDPETEAVLLQVDKTGKSVMTRIRSSVDLEYSQRWRSGKEPRK
jgi:hypothetical protein